MSGVYHKAVTPTFITYCLTGALKDVPIKVIAIPFAFTRLEACHNGKMIPFEAHSQQTLNFF